MTGDRQGGYATTITPFKYASCRNIIIIKVPRGLLRFTLICTLNVIEGERFTIGTPSYQQRQKMMMLVTIKKCEGYHQLWVLLLFCGTECGYVLLVVCVCFIVVGCLSIQSLPAKPLVLLIICHRLPSPSHPHHRITMLESPRRDGWTVLLRKQQDQNSRRWWLGEVKQNGSFLSSIVLRSFGCCRLADDVMVLTLSPAHFRCEWSACVRAHVSYTSCSKRHSTWPVNGDTGTVVSWMKEGNI